MNVVVTAILRDIGDNEMTKSNNGSEKFIHKCVEVKTRNFKSKEAYRKTLAYGHIHNIYKNTPGNFKVKIRGKPHKVQHIKVK